MRATHTAALQSEINVTPLVDVCLVLLIIFMVMTPLIVTGMPVNLPRATTGENLRNDPLRVTINADHVIWVGDHVLRMDELAAELGRQHAQANRPVIVRGDKSLAYGDVVAVLDACRAAGFDEVGLGTQLALDQRP